MSLFIPAQVAINKPATAASWTPADLPDIYSWYDAQYGGSITKDGSNLVAQWNDRTANSAHLTQSNGTNKPTYSETALGSYAGITFSTSSYLSSLTNAGLDFLRAQGKVSVIMVMRHNTRSSAKYFYYWSTNANTFTRLRLNDVGDGRFQVSIRQLDSDSRYDDNTNSSYIQPTGTNIIVRQSLDFSTRYPKIYTSYSGDSQDIENASQLATTNSFSDTRSYNSHIGSNDGTSTAQFSMGEFILVRDVLTAGEITSLNTYLKAKWGIS